MIFKGYVSEDLTQWLYQTVYLEHSMNPLAMEASRISRSLLSILAPLPAGPSSTDHPTTTTASSSSSVPLVTLVSELEALFAAVEQWILLFAKDINVDFASTALATSPHEVREHEPSLQQVFLSRSVVSLVLFMEVMPVLWAVTNFLDNKTRIDEDEDDDDDFILHADQANERQHQPQSGSDEDLVDTIRAICCDLFRWQSSHFAAWGGCAASRMFPPSCHVRLTFQDLRQAEDEEIAAKKLEIEEEERNAVFPTEEEYFATLVKAIWRGALLDNPLHLKPFFGEVEDEAEDVFLEFEESDDPNQELIEVDDHVRFRRGANWMQSFVRRAAGFPVRYCDTTIITTRNETASFLESNSVSPILRDGAYMFFTRYYFHETLRNDRLQHWSLLTMSADGRLPLGSFPPFKKDDEKDEEHGWWIERCVAAYGPVGSSVRDPQRPAPSSPQTKDRLDDEAKLFLNRHEEERVRASVTQCVSKVFSSSTSSSDAPAAVAAAASVVPSVNPPVRGPVPAAASRLTQNLFTSPPPLPPPPPGHPQQQTTKTVVKEETFATPIQAAVVKRTRKYVAPEAFGSASLWHQWNWYFPWLLQDICLTVPASNRSDAQRAHDTLQKQEAEENEHQTPEPTIQLPPPEPQPVEGEDVISLVSTPVVPTQPPLREMKSKPSSSDDIHHPHPAESKCRGIPFWLSFVQAWWYQSMPFFRLRSHRPDFFETEEFVQIAKTTLREFLVCAMEEASLQCLWADPHASRSPLSATTTTTDPPPKWDQPPVVRQLSLPNKVKQCPQVEEHIVAAFLTLITLTYPDVCVLAVGQALSDANKDLVVSTTDPSAPSAPFWTPWQMFVRNVRPLLSKYRLLSFHVGLLDSLTAVTELLNHDGFDEEDELVEGEVSPDEKDGKLHRRRRRRTSRDDGQLWSAYRYRPHTVSLPQFVKLFVSSPLLHTQRQEEDATSIRALISARNWSGCFVREEDEGAAGTSSSSSSQQYCSSPGGFSSTRWLVRVADLAGLWFFNAREFCPIMPDYSHNLDVRGQMAQYARRALSTWELRVTVGAPFALSTLLAIHKEIAKRQLGGATVGTADPKRTAGEMLLSASDFLWKEWLQAATVDAAGKSGFHYQFHFLTAVYRQSYLDGNGYDEERQSREGGGADMGQQELSWRLHLRSGCENCIRAGVTFFRRFHHRKHQFSFLDTGLNFQLTYAVRKTCRVLLWNDPQAPDEYHQLVYELFNDVAMQALLTPIPVRSYSRNKSAGLSTNQQEGEWNVDPNWYLTDALKTINNDSPLLKKFLDTVEIDVLMLLYEWFCVSMLTSQQGQSQQQQPQQQKSLQSLSLPGSSSSVTALDEMHPSQPPQEPRHLTLPAAPAAPAEAPAGAPPRVSRHNAALLHKKIRRRYDNSHFESVMSICMMSAACKRISERYRKEKEWNVPPPIPEGSSLRNNKLEQQRIPLSSAIGSPSPSPTSSSPPPFTTSSSSSSSSSVSMMGSRHGSFEDYYSDLEQPAAPQSLAWLEALCKGVIFLNPSFALTSRRRHRSFTKKIPPPNGFVSRQAPKILKMFENWTVGPNKEIPRREELEQLVEQVITIHLIHFFGKESHIVTTYQNILYERRNASARSPVLLRYSSEDSTLSNFKLEGCEESNASVEKQHSYRQEDDDTRSIAETYLEEYIRLDLELAFSRLVRYLEIDDPQVHSVSTPQKGLDKFSSDERNDYWGEVLQEMFVVACQHWKLFVSTWTIAGRMNQLFSALYLGTDPCEAYNNLVAAVEGVRNSSAINQQKYDKLERNSEEQAEHDLHDGPLPHTSSDILPAALHGNFSIAHFLRDVLHGHSSSNDLWDHVENKEIQPARELLEFVTLAANSAATTERSSGLRPDEKSSAPLPTLPCRNVEYWASASFLTNNLELHEAWSTLRAGLLAASPFASSSREHLSSQGEEGLEQQDETDDGDEHAENRQGRDDDEEEEEEEEDEEEKSDFRRENSENAPAPPITSTFTLEQQDGSSLDLLHPLLLAAAEKLVVHPGHALIEGRPGTGKSALIRFMITCWKIIRLAQHDKHVRKQQHHLDVDDEDDGSLFSKVKSHPPRLQDIRLAKRLTETTLAVPNFSVVSCGSINYWNSLCDLVPQPTDPCPIPFWRNEAAHLRMQRDSSLSTSSSAAGHLMMKSENPRTQPTVRIPMHTLRFQRFTRVCRPLYHAARFGFAIVFEDFHLAPLELRSKLLELCLRGKEGMLIQMEEYDSDTREYRIVNVRIPVHESFRFVVSYCRELDLLADQDGENVTQRLLTYLRGDSYAACVVLPDLLSGNFLRSPHDDDDSGGENERKGTTSNATKDSSPVIVAQHAVLNYASHWAPMIAAVGVCGIPLREVLRGIRKDDNAAQGDDGDDDAAAAATTIPQTIGLTWLHQSGSRGFDRGSLLSLRYLLTTILTWSWVRSVLHISSEIGKDDNKVAAANVAFFLFTWSDLRLAHRWILNLLTHAMFLRTEDSQIYLTPETAFGCALQASQSLQKNLEERLDSAAAVFSSRKAVLDKFDSMIEHQLRKVFSGGYTQIPTVELYRYALRDLHHPGTLQKSLSCSQQQQQHSTNHPYVYAPRSSDDTMLVTPLVPVRWGGLSPLYELERPATAAYIGSGMGGRKGGSATVATSTTTTPPSWRLHVDGILRAIMEALSAEEVISAYGWCYVPNPTGLREVIRSLLRQQTVSSSSAANNNDSNNNHHYHLAKKVWVFLHVIEKNILAPLGSSRAHHQLHNADQSSSSGRSSLASCIREGVDVFVEVTSAILTGQATVPLISGGSGAVAVSDAAYDAVNAIESSASRCFASLHLKIGLYTILRANSRLVLLCSALRLSDTLAWIPSRLQQRHVLISYPSMETTCVDKNLGAVLVVRQALQLERSFVDAGFIQTEDQHGLFVDTKGGDRCAANEARILVIRAGDSIARQQQQLDTLRTAVLEGQTLILHGADCLSPLLNDLVTRLLQLSMPHVLMWFPSKVPHTAQQFSTSVVSSPYRIYHEKECDHNHITSYRRSKRGDGETRGRMIAVSQYFRLIVFAPHAWLETHPSQQQPTVMRLHANAWAPMIVPQDSLIKEFLEKEGAQETQSQPHPKDYASNSSFVSAFLPTFRDPSLSYINFDRDVIDHLVIHPDSLRDVRSFLHMYLIFHIRNEVLTYLEKLLPRADRDDDSMSREGREDPTGRMRETAKEVLKLLASYWKLYHERSDPGSPLLWIMLLHRFYFLRQKNRNKMFSSSSTSPSAPLMRDCRLELLNLYSLDYTETSRTGEMLLMVPQELFA